MKERGNVRGYEREDVWSNKGFSQRSEFKGQQGFGYESRPSTATFDPLPEAFRERRGGGGGYCCKVIVFIFLHNSPWPPLSSICTSLLHPFISSLQLSTTHKLLFFLLLSFSIHSLSLASIHGPREQSRRFIGRTWPYCVRMRRWGKKKRKKRGRVCSAVGVTLKGRVVLRSKRRSEDLGGGWRSDRP